MFSKDVINQFASVKVKQVMQQLGKPTDSQIFPYKHILIGTFDLTKQVFIIITYFWQQYLNLRQLRRTLVKEVPRQLEAFGISQHQFVHQQNYAFEKISFQMLSLSIKKAVDILCIIANVLPFVWDNLDVIFPIIDTQSEFQKAVAFIVIEAYKIKAFDVPFSVYEMYVIERRYNNTVKSFDLFIYDMVIESGLMLIIYPPIIFGYLRVVELGGQYFFIFMQVFILLVALTLTWIHPNFIAPLFNQFKELNNPLLKVKIHHLANITKFPLNKIYWMNNSIRSAHSNAYFYGFGKNKMIVLYDTLLKQLNCDEISSVICHQIGHWYKSHSFQMLLVYIVKGFSMFYIFSFFIKSNEILRSFGFYDSTTFIGTALFFHLIQPLLLIFDTFQLVLNRKFQFQADLYACKLSYKEPLKQALIKITNERTVIPPDPLYAWFKFSHPTLHERIANINCYEQNLAKDH